jgi:peptide methionine sulfoxide reductase MsrB
MKPVVDETSSPSGSPAERPAGARGEHPRCANCPSHHVFSGETYPTPTATDQRNCINSSG